MRIIISPAKAMVSVRDKFRWQELPEFYDKSLQILEKLKSMDYDALKNLWKSNDEIAKLNIQRLTRMELDKELSPAILSYDGIQYHNIDPQSLDEDSLSYLQENLRILSGFYGVLRPFDGIRPYRLEMQAKLQIGTAKDLYSFWGCELAESVFRETDCIINLASKEYSRCISKYLPEHIRFVTCLFGEEKDGKLIEKGTMCKIARGEMVRWLAQNKVTEAEKLSGFEGKYHRYSPEYSDEKTIAFIKK
ncbi:MAG: peroxide stress protein YaaA [Oscillospiraceae bacterium]|nr:peroxide stress protein YaaA [Oscillospiraceae bacterium]